MSVSSESTLRIKVRAAKMWLVLAALLFVVAGLSAAFNATPVLILAVIVAIALAVLGFGLFGAKQRIDFGDEIVVGYLARQRHIRWSEIVFVSFEEEHLHIPTGIPFMGIPTTNQLMTITLQGGEVFSVSIDPNVRPDIARTVLAHANLDEQAEIARRDGLDRSDRRSTALVFAFVGFGLFVVCVVLSVLTAGEVVGGFLSKRWPTAEGILVRASVETERSGSAERPTIRYKPSVKYQYVVAGKQYSGNRYHFCLQVSSEQEVIQDRLAGLQPGAKVRVHYDPDTPSRSVLVPGVDTERYVVLGIFCLGAIVALAFGSTNARRLVLGDFSPQPKGSFGR